MAVEAVVRIEGMVAALSCRGYSYSRTMTVRRRNEDVLLKCKKLDFLVRIL